MYIIFRVNDSLLLFTFDLYLVINCILQLLKVLLINQIILFI